MIEITLGGLKGAGCIAIVSDEDSYLADYNWFLKHGYATRFDKEKRKHVKMHHYIMPLRYSLQVDHINRNRLDNRRENLRLVTPRANANNASLRKDNSSGFRGVVWHEAMKKWCAQISLNGKTIPLGYANTPEEAYAIYIVAREYKQHWLDYFEWQENQLKREGLQT